MTASNDTPIDWTARSKSFDSVAHLYDAYRPGYPAAMIEDILQYAGVRPEESSILEIGSGTGKATRQFAQRGFPILCLEPGARLLNAAAQNLAGFPAVRFIQARFEDWEPGPEQFDLIISAQAFHWVPYAVRFEKTARLLKPHGTLALFWNMYPGTMGEIRRELDEIYRQYAPDILKPGQPCETQIAFWTGALRESPSYENLVVKQYPWSARYDTQSYLGLLNTYSDHLSLPEERRKVLFEKIAEAIDRRGGSIERPYLGVVYLAQKA